jgi:hypothetical protein
MKKKITHSTISDIKCAPSKEYLDGSCFSHETLKQIADNYNNKNIDKINLNISKSELVKEIDNRLNDKCSNQICWLRLDVVKELNNKDIINNTFRPNGPNKKYEWLSTTHINNVIQQYHSVYNDFLFLGAVPLDFEDLPLLHIHNLNFNELVNNGKTKIGIVINLDEHWKDGSHWVSLYTDLLKNQVYYFDSTGANPMKKTRIFINKITKYMYSKKYNKQLPLNDVVQTIKSVNKLKEDNVETLKKKNEHIKNLLDGSFDIRHNHIQHQFKNSECGVYSINFIVRLVSGESFDDIINNITKDDEMNKNRKIYFRNVN